MKTITISEKDYQTIIDSLSYFVSLTWWDIEPEIKAEIETTLENVKAAAK